MAEHTTHSEAQDNNLLPSLAHRIGQHTSVSTLFGRPIEHDNVTVVPVAQVRYAFGGGAGTREGGEQGQGGGAAVKAIPMGFIQIRGKQVRYRALRRSRAKLGWAVIAGGVIATAVWLNNRRHTGLRRWMASRR